MQELRLKMNLSVVELQMTAPSLDDTMPDNERLSWAIEAATGIESVKLTYQVLKKAAGCTAGQ